VKFWKCVEKSAAELRDPATKETLAGVGPVLRNPTMTSTWGGAGVGASGEREREGGREGRLRSGFLEEKEESEREREQSESNTQLATLTTSPASNCAPVCFGNQTEVRTPSRGSGMLVRGCIWAEAEKGKKVTFFSHGIGSEEG
jgi:hypothetical protein